MITGLLIFATANLYQAACQALLEDQPRISVSGVTGDLVGVSDSRPIEPMAILVDVPTIQPDLVSKLRAASPGSGLLFLVESYDLEEIVNLLRFGATGFITRDASTVELAQAIPRAPRLHCGLYTTTMVRSSDRPTRKQLN